MLLNLMGPSGTFREQKMARGLPGTSQPIQVLNC